MILCISLERVLFLFCRFRLAKRCFATGFALNTAIRLMSLLPMPSPYFAFEQDFVGSLRCIPMQVRHSLDMCGVKLKLEHWNKFTEAERQSLVEWPCNTSQEAQTYREKLQSLITQRCGAPAKTLDIPDSPPWQTENAIPPQVIDKFRSQDVSLSQAQWASLTELQRFALIKLSRPSHENANFMPAVKEFGLASDSIDKRR